MVFAIKNDVVGQRQQNVITGVRLDVVEAIELKGRISCSSSFYNRGRASEGYSHSEKKEYNPREYVPISHLLPPPRKS